MEKNGKCMEEPLSERKKEDQKGVALISEFCGCSSVLTGAFKINPWNASAAPRIEMVPIGPYRAIDGARYGL